MRNHNSNPRILTTALLLWAATTANALILYRANTQVIWYDGALSGQFIPSNTSNANCTAFTFARMTNASMTVGVNAPWDKNPFFWSLANTGTQAPPGSGLCISAGGCTNDAVYNLDFASADYRCFKNGERCGQLVFAPFYYVPLQMVDVGVATVQAITDGSGRKGYNVTGDPGRYVSNGTVSYGFDLQTPKNYSTRCDLFNARGGFGSVHIDWTDSLPWNYSLSFTNITVSASMVLRAGVGTVVMSFTGERLLNSSALYAYNSRYNTSIALDTSNPNKPQFTYANGSQIGWKEYSGNEYTAYASSTSSSNSAGRNAPRWWSGLLIGVAVACI